MPGSWKEVGVLSSKYLLVVCVCVCVCVYVCVCVREVVLQNLAGQTGSGQIVKDLFC